MRLSDFDYELPHELIAQHPLPVRDESRLLVLNRKTGNIEHRKFFNIVEYLNTGDVLVLNDTKVIPAKLIGKRQTGAKVEALLIKQDNNGNWHAMLNTNAKLRIGEEIIFEDGAIRGTLADRPQPKGWIIHLESLQPSALSPQPCTLDVLSRVGRIPLPPYIKRVVSDEQRAMSNEDRERYQTVFAQKEGAIAAPTAGLHFTDTLLDKIKCRGIEIVFVTLHVGPGTFLPIEFEDIEKHVMQREYYEFPEKSASVISQAKKEGRRIIAVGSTSCRVLEATARSGTTEVSSGWTNLFIYPPYRFKVVDVLITNFHLPKTTLLLLVSAFAGRKEILTAYEIAKKERYRFYSYGDAMLII
ncbi:MAG TPA: tRNA preQ1(34) S-adenosylmethionine ribosyltransferase-isomerase QueA [Candidatus Brocadiia bacterium]